MPGQGTDNSLPPAETSWEARRARHVKKPQRKAAAESGDWRRGSSQGAVGEPLGPRRAQGWQRGVQEGGLTESLSYDGGSGRLFAR